MLQKVKNLLEEEKMKVLLINGSPHKEGATHRALREVEETLKACGIETKIFWIGNEPIAGCIGCGACEYYCPVRPLSAIYVDGYDVHHLI